MADGGESPVFTVGVQGGYSFCDAQVRDCAEDSCMSSGAVSSFVKHHFRHFNAAALVDAAEAYQDHLESGGGVVGRRAGAGRPRARGEWCVVTNRAAARD